LLTAHSPKKIMKTCLKYISFRNNIYIYIYIEREKSYRKYLLKNMKCKTNQNYEIEKIKMMKI